MQRAKSFRTKTGYCHVLSDRIVFTPRGLVGKLGDLTVEGKMKRVLILFSSLTILILYFAYITYLKDEFVWASCFGLIGSYLLYGSIKGLTASIHPIISREKIKEVKLIKGISALSPPSFEVNFTNEKNQIRKRMITLYSSAPKFQNEVQSAIRIMTEEGLLH